MTKGATMAGVTRRAWTVLAALVATTGGMLAAGPAAAAQTTAASSSAATWQRVPTPDPNHDTELDAVSCASTSACTAVGWTSVNGRFTTPVSLALDLLVGVSLTASGTGSGTAPPSPPTTVTTGASAARTACPGGAMAAWPPRWPPKPRPSASRRWPSGGTDAAGAHSPSLP